MPKKYDHPVSSALMGVALIQAVVCFLGWMTYGPTFTPIDWLVTFSFILFGGLALWARKARVPAALCAAGLYGVFLLWQATCSMELLKAGMIFKVPIVILILVAVALAFTSKKQAE